jgi:hypothetical protein
MSDIIRKKRQLSRMLFVWLGAVAAIAMIAGCATMEEPSSELSREDVRVSEQMKVPDASREDLFLTANKWLGEKLMTDETFIEYTSRKNGFIIGTIVFSGLTQGEYKFSIRFNIKIRIKEGSTTITLFDPMYSPIGVFGGTFSERQYKPMRSEKWFNEYCLPKYRELISSYKEMLASH